MKNAATYFNKLQNLNPQLRASKNISMLAHKTGLLLEMADSDIRYQYFVKEAAAAPKSVEFPFSVLYGLRKPFGYTMTDTEVTFDTVDGDVVTAHHLLEKDAEVFQPVAKMDIEMLADALYGASTFAKKGKHLYNQHTFISLNGSFATVYSATDISVFRGSYDAEVYGKGTVGIENTIIPKIKKWLNYANDPKNGGGDNVWISVAKNKMKLQVQNCTIIFTISALPAYASIITNLDALLNHPYDKTEFDMDWDALRAAIKTKDEMIDIEDCEMLRTYISDFVNHYSLQTCYAWRLNTERAAFMVETDFTCVLMTMKQKF